MSIALLCLATGQSYWQFIAPFLASARVFFPPHITYLFTDCRKTFPAEMIKQEPEGYPLSTLHRYHYFLRFRPQIEPQFTHVFYCDIDSLFVNTITEEDIACDGITATSHAGFHNGSPGSRTYERRPKSTACIPGLGDCYYAGGFVGGTVGEFFQMCETISRNVDTDDRNGVLAEWHDESHLNRYLLDHPPARVLTPAYHFPEPLWLQHEFRAMWKQDIQPRIVCLEKRWKVA